MNELKQSLLALLPKGSLFRSKGKVYQALLNAIISQFSVLIETFRYLVLQQSPLTCDNLSDNYDDLNLDLSKYPEPQQRQVSNMVKFMSNNLTKEQFYQLLLNLFPGITAVVTPGAVLALASSQVGAFVVGASQVSGFSSQLDPDQVIIIGKVSDQLQFDLLKWFLWRYDRAKHKHVYEINIGE